MKTAAIADIVRLLEEKAIVAQTDPLSPAFVKWRQEALRALRNAFGPDSAHVSDFEKIRFEIAPPLIEEAKRKLPKFIHRRGNVAKIVATPLGRSKENHFIQAMAKAADLLLCAKLELMRLKK